MSGREIENLLRLIDENLSTNNKLFRKDVMEFLSAHPDRVLQELRDHGRATIPSSPGDVIIDLAQLQAAIA